MTSRKPKPHEWQISATEVPGKLHLSCIFCDLTREFLSTQTMRRLLMWTGERDKEGCPIS
jgi:hypothetical protein